jgi:hypothetical protein
MVVQFLTVAISDIRSSVAVSMSNTEVTSVEEKFTSTKPVVWKNIVTSIINWFAQLFRWQVWSDQPDKSVVEQKQSVNPDWLEEINTTTAKELKKNEN